MPPEDPITKQIRDLRSELPAPRRGLSEAEKDTLIAAVGGPRTCQSILNARKHAPEGRIPFIFNSLDSQMVVDILANDMRGAIERALLKRSQEN